LLPSWYLLWFCVFTVVNSGYYLPICTPPRILYLVKIDHVAKA
jgi:hypothetical protein